MLARRMLARKRSRSGKEFPMFRSVKITLCSIGVAVTAIASSCKREDRGFRVEPPLAELATEVQIGGVHAGGPSATQPVKNEYEQNAYAMGEGQNLYEQFNC